jgi:hypothetical protein
MSSARLGSPVTLKLPMLTSMILPSLSFSRTPPALCAEIKTLYSASIHPLVQIIMSISNAVTSNSAGDCSAPFAIRTPVPWIRGGLIMRRFHQKLCSPTSNWLGEISFRSCAAPAGALRNLVCRGGWDKPTGDNMPRRAKKRFAPSIAFCSLSRRYGVRSGHGAGIAVL